MIRVVIMSETHRKNPNPWQNSWLYRSYRTILRLQCSNTFLSRPWEEVLGSLLILFKLKKN